MSSCALDSAKSKFDAKRAVQDARALLKAYTGVTDADIDQIAAAARGEASAAVRYGVSDLSKCKAVQTNRKIGTVQIVALAASLITMLLLIARGGSSVVLERSLMGFTVLIGALSLAQWRHSISLAFKLGWFGSGTTTRVQAVLATASAIITLLYTGLKRRAGAPVLVALLVVLSGVAGANIYYTARSVAQPQASALTAVTGALNGVVTADRISAARRLALSEAKAVMPA